ncbi:MAG: DUF308 domain-containing protein [Arachidicoccus sp.]|nr:DUF308 domain-containing protein [Arachidicoccus sp.]
MENQFVTAVRYWYLPLIIGIIFILTGFWIFWTPLEAYLGLSFIFSFSFLVSGIIEITYYITNRHATKNWGWGLAAGIIDLLFGIWLISSPLVSLQLLPFFVGLILLLRSSTAIAVALDLRGLNSSWWGWIMFFGILGIIFSFIIIWNPLIGGMTIIIWTALTFITVGIYRILLAFELKKIKDRK